MDTLWVLGGIFGPDLVGQQRNVHRTHLQRGSTATKQCFSLLRGLCCVRVYVAPTFGCIGFMVDLLWAKVGGRIGGGIGGGGGCTGYNMRSLFLLQNQNECVQHI